ncbi:MAG: hypothetical protein OXG69_02000 [bacterium]|nr:hypothetical protein [bacterium]
MEENRTRVCELIVGLGEVEVLGVEDEPGELLTERVRARRRPVCGAAAVWSKGSTAVSLVDLPAFGWLARLVWLKQRWRCPAARCAVGSCTGAGARRHHAPPISEAPVLGGRGPAEEECASAPSRRVALLAS